MFINEIPQNTAVTLSCFSGNKWVRFGLKTDPLQGPKAIKAVGDAVNGKFIVTEPARSQGKVINFPPEFRYELSYASAGKLNLWSSVRVYNLQIDKPKKRVRVIISNEKSQRTDRRRAYRLRIDVKGEARFGDTGSAEEIYVKDVSSSGIGVIATERNTKAQAGDLMFITFTEPKRNTTFSIRTKVVRTENIEHGKKIYGAVIIGDRAKKEVTQFIEKERKMVSQK